MKHDTSWGKVADWYDEYLGSEDSYQKNVILPNILRIVNPRAGDYIADIACGQGFFSEAVALQKARVVGVDISRELVQKAVDRFEQKKMNNGKFHVGSADDLNAIQSSTIDTAMCILALQNIKELDKTFQEIARILRRPKKQDTVALAIKNKRDVKDSPAVTYGRLVMVINHPAFRIPQSSDWFYDDRPASTNRDRQGRVVYQYLSEGTIKIDMNPGIPKERAREKKYTISYHRPLQVFVKLLSKHGFSITRLEEWSSHKKSQGGPRAKAEDEARKEIPMFMCIEATLVK